MERCARCGEELRPDANFCPHCGARVVRPLASENGWELCEIVTRTRWLGTILPKRYIEVAVEGRGQEGVFHVPVKGACLRKEYGDLGDEGKEAVEAAVGELLDTGWEMTPERGAGWWSYRFRRPAQHPAVMMQPDLSTVAAV